MQHVILVKSLWFSYHTQEMRGNSEPWEVLLKAQGRRRKAKTDRGGEHETEINDNVIWWHSWASYSPLVVSPSTNSELKRVNFVWIGFNLPIRRYEAGGVLQVFPILPQDNCVRFCKCTSTYTSAWHIDRQLVQIKNWLNCWEKVFTETHAHDNRKQKQSDSLCWFSETVCPWCWKEIFPIVEKGSTYFFHSKEK